MKSELKGNIGHSIFQKLLNHARRSGEDFNLLLARYGVERFLYRLSISTHSEAFIRKSRAENVPDSISEVMKIISKFVIPLVDAIQTNSTFKMVWKKNGPWCPK